VASAISCARSPALLRRGGVSANRRNSPEPSPIRSTKPMTGNGQTADHRHDCSAKRAQPSKLDCDVLLCGVANLEARSESFRLGFRGETQGLCRARTPFVLATAPASGSTEVSPCSICEPDGHRPCALLCHSADRSAGHLSRHCHRHERGPARGMTGCSSSRRCETVLIVPNLRIASRTRRDPLSNARQSRSVASS
jgi:hypothetical protein